MFRPALTTLFATPVLAGALLAQGPQLLLTFSQPEQTLSGSGGTSLRFLNPNEIAHLDFMPCPVTGAEKWAPRTCFHAMAGDENTDALYWNPAIFGAIDALVATVSATPIGGVNQRTIFYSPSVAMGTGVSGLPGLRPGDVGRIVRTSAGDGKVEYFMRREQFNQALGLPLNTAIDIDAIAFSLSHGVFFSLDQDILCNTICGPTLVRDGDVIGIDPAYLNYTSDFRIATVTPNSAMVVYDEAQMDVFVQSAQVTNRFGVCINQSIDLESLEIDWTSGNVVTITRCAGAIMQVPDLLFSTETMTGASLLTTAGGGTIYQGGCGQMGRGCGGGPTFGYEAGLLPPSSTVGVPSYINGLLSTWTCRYVMEVRQPVMNSSPSGLPAGATPIDIGSPAPMNFVFIHLAPMGFNAVPSSVPTFPWSLFCFPDTYQPLWFYQPVPTINGFATFPSPGIPPNFPVKVLFQSVGIVNGLIEFSTPAMWDVL